MKRLVTADYVGKISNHFELVLVASARAKEILSGRASVEDKYKGSTAGVIALNEIADDVIDVKAIEEGLPDLYNQGLESSGSAGKDQVGQNFKNSHRVDTQEDTTDLLFNASLEEQEADNEVEDVSVELTHEEDFTEESLEESGE